MIWSWIKRLFKPNPQKDAHLELYEDLDYSKMTKHDLKKLKAQGKIKDIYPPYIQSCNFIFLIYRFVMSLKMVLINALEDRYNAKISEADATIKIYLTNSVGIGEHPQHLDEIDKQLGIITDAEEKLTALQAFKI